MGEYQCEHCAFRFESSRAPHVCPHCGERGKVRPTPSASEILDEIEWMEKEPSREERRARREEQ
ncbi:MAG: hypothetical protein K6T16_02155 [Candidatus Pacearchaeota archaeon]|nr:hypothetical protein [Candidatus Pacearchaeota archaeon]